MVSFVKLKKKIAEMKRFLLKQILSRSVFSEGRFNNILDDPSYVSPPKEEITKQSYWVSIFEYLTAKKMVGLVLMLFSRIPTIEPSSKFKLIWDFLLGIVLIVYFFFIPVHIAINEPIHILITQELGYALHVFMAIDIVLSMNTAYFEKGVNMFDKRKILIYYLKNYLWSDVVSQLPLLYSELGS
jgi:putative effector of murein hydrolase LrgA (UPF0299 family)